MDDVPEKLDGATVRWFAPATPGQMGHDYETGDPVPVAYYAIAQYEGDGQQAYLFGVSADHQVVADTLWESVEEAKSVAANSSMVNPSMWQTRG